MARPGYLLTSESLKRPGVVGETLVDDRSPNHAMPVKEEQIKYGTFTQADDACKLCHICIIDV